jgi:hypothetical protein
MKRKTICASVIPRGECLSFKLTIQSSQFDQKRFSRRAELVLAAVTSPAFFSQIEGWFFGIVIPLEEGGCREEVEIH